MVPVARTILKCIELYKFSLAFKIIGNVLAAIQVLINFDNKEVLDIQNTANWKSDTPFKDSLWSKPALWSFMRHRLSSLVLCSLADTAYHWYNVWQTVQEKSTHHTSYDICYLLSRAVWLQSAKTFPSLHVLFIHHSSISYAHTELPLCTQELSRKSKDSSLTRRALEQKYTFRRLDVGWKTGSWSLSFLTVHS